MFYNLFWQNLAHIMAEGCVLLTLLKENNQRIKSPQSAASSYLLKVEWNQKNNRK